MCLKPTSKFAIKAASQALTAVLFVSALALFGTWPAAAFDRPSPDKVQPEDRPIVIRWRQSDDILRPAGRDRLVAVASTIQTRHTITDEDLAFVLEKLEAEPIVNKGDNKLTLQCMALCSLIGGKHTTKPQATKIMASLVPLTNSHNSTVAFYAAGVLGSTRDALVIPVLERIVKTSPYAKVRGFAGQNLPRLKELAKSGAI